MYNWLYTFQKQLFCHYHAGLTMFSEYPVCWVFQLFICACKLLICFFKAIWGCYCNKWSRRCNHYKPVSKLAYVKKMCFDRNIKVVVSILQFPAFLWTRKCLIFTEFVISRERTRYRMFDVRSFYVADFCAMLGNILMQFFWVTNVILHFEWSFTVLWSSRMSLSFCHFLLHKKTFSPVFV
jgi:hypothetical protein